MPFKSEDLAYIAGLIDGEGYIGISRSRERRRTREYWCYIPRLTVAMTDPEGVDFLNKILGGKVYLQIRKEKDNRKDIYVWSLHSRNIIKSTLEILIPFLKVKHKQAIKLLEFVNSRAKNKNYITEEIQMYLDISKLNGGCNSIH